VQGTVLRLNSSTNRPFGCEQDYRRRVLRALAQELSCCVPLHHEFAVDQLIGGFAQLGWVALKALLLYVTAVIGFRLGERRTLAEMSAFDFIAAVGVGAIIGRVPNSSTTSYVSGAVTLVTLLVTHGVISRLRYLPPVASFVDHPPRVLVQDGRVLSSELKRAGTES
jgi:hypothetical protein